MVVSASARAIKTKRHAHRGMAPALYKLCPTDERVARGLPAARAARVSLEARGQKGAHERHGRQDPEGLGDAKGRCGDAKAQ